MKHLLPRETTQSALGETIQVWGSIEIDDDGFEATIHSKVDGHRKETDCFFGKTFKELEADMGSSNYPFDALMEKVRSLRYWPKLKKGIEQEELQHQNPQVHAKPLTESERNYFNNKLNVQEKFNEELNTLAQNNDGRIKLIKKVRVKPYYDTVLARDGGKIETNLQPGNPKDVEFDKSSNSFIGILETKEGEYNFEIDAENGNVIRKDKII